MPNPKHAKDADAQRERDIENAVDDWIEEKHITEVPQICEGMGEDYL